MIAMELSEQYEVMAGNYPNFLEIMDDATIPIAGDTLQICVGSRGRLHAFAMYNDPSRIGCPPPSRSMTHPAILSSVPSTPSATSSGLSRA